MAVGFQSFAADGSTALDLTSRALKIFGTLNIGTSYTSTTATGTVTDANFTAYTGCAPWSATISGVFASVTEAPTFSVSGNVLTWTFPGTTRPNTTIIYGIF